MKTKHIITYVISIFLASSIFSCRMMESADLDIGHKKGEVAFNIEGDDSLIPVTYARTKGTMDISDFCVEIRNENGVLVKYFEKFSEMPNRLDMKIGQYSIKALSHLKQENAAFDAPYYEGATTFEVKENETSDVEVTCTLSNMKVSVNYDPNFETYFKDYHVVVSNGMKLGMLDFTKAEIRPGYFQVNPLELEMTVITRDDQTFSKTFTIKDVAARDHHQITFSPQVGDSGISIEIDDTTNDKEIDLDVPNEDLDPDAIISIEGDGFDIDQPLEISEGNEPAVVLNIEAGNGIDALKIRIESDILTPEELESVGLVEEFDIANTDPDSELGQALKALGFIGDTPIKNQKEIQFDLTEFMPLLTMLGTDETHHFHVTLIDNYGKEEVKTLTVNVIP
ncbi:DUF4493 domain-containing protein [Flammeovirga yaeyamensis]|uniref:DUF4493 domain-containing protein n=1 Tax=Flammeovirga yaeyamensis TaxID=367791 RepID=A0AAX1NFG3_9BACT|nr:DUF4493 domain-containing protein [Flammeovirga yaeyamensis]MBB3697163.1 hypothetical protein [Flammeovirga yaeyamensis]NMF33823.1 DUF4493 domain-containing protein [Flammeovirga yaeyamensis]QWG04913.1 DUF4493 domain-containing protein [Flammeovirga yaeyamensis]